MIENNVNLDLMAFVETEILPRYAMFDAAHDLRHVNSVISKSVTLARQVGADVNMAYAVAAYHDLGLEGPRAVHHITSGRLLAADRRLSRWFSDAQIEIMRQAVEDHRASASHAPRNVYGKIVAEADRELEPLIVLRRTIQFGLDRYPELGKEEHWKRMLSHLDSKYSRHGYIRLWIASSENAANLEKLREMLVEKRRLRELFEVIYAEETSR